MCWTPFSSGGGPNGPTTVVDGSRHLLRTNTLLLCRGMCKMLSFVLVWLLRLQILDGPNQTRIFAKERNEQP